MKEQSCVSMRSETEVMERSGGDGEEVGVGREKERKERKSP